MMHSVCLLGATGSIGTQVLDIIREKKEEFQLFAMSFGKNIDKAYEIIDEFHPQFVVTSERNLTYVLHEKYPNLEIGCGDTGLQQVVSIVCPNPMVINALVGAIGAVPTMAALEMKRDVYLANKETLVIAGEIVMAKAKEKGCKIIPIDSEHSAIAQLLEGKNKEEVKEIVITASGGSLRDVPLEKLENVTPEEALNHPNWAMGQKITIDCATMANKGFEVMEAHHLFGLDYDQIKTVYHRESLVHSFVTFKDNSTFAQMGNPDMHLPIQYAMYQGHVESKLLTPLSIEEMGELHFAPLDKTRYPLLDLAYAVGRKGGIYPTVFNAANEVAVKLFLLKKIKFTEITNIIQMEIADSLYENFQKGELSMGKILMVNELVRNKLASKYR
jgi:1-deoxy-D-xylulose-5-phosphate reductoisomerase